MADKILRLPFLDTAQAASYKERLLRHLDQGSKFNHNIVFGVPLVRVLTRNEDYRPHNNFMRSVFPDLLEEIRSFLEHHLKENCFYDENIGLPGFHIFQILPGGQRPIWFHTDDMASELMKNHAHFKVRPDSRQLIFTVLLDLPSGLQAGLRYFEDDTLGKRVKAYDQFKHKDFEHFASMHSYNVGEMNVYGDIVHSVFAFNETGETINRITIQGQLVRTDRGNLIYW